MSLFGDDFSRFAAPALSAMFGPESVAYRRYGGDAELLAGYPLTLGCLSFMGGPAQEVERDGGIWMVQTGELVVTGLDSHAGLTDEVDLTTGGVTLRWSVSREIDRNDETGVVTLDVSRSVRLAARRRR